MMSPQVYFHVDQLTHSVAPRNCPGGEPEHFSI